MARVADLIGAVIHAVTTPGPQAGIMTVSTARAFLTSSVIFLVLGVLIVMRLQFSRYRQRASVRWSAAACFIAVLMCGAAAIACGSV